MNVQPNDMSGINWAVESVTWTQTIYFVWMWFHQILISDGCMVVCGGAIMSSIKQMNKKNHKNGTDVIEWHLILKNYESISAIFEIFTDINYWYMHIQFFSSF